MNFDGASFGIGFAAGGLVLGTIVGLAIYCCLSLSLLKAFRR